MKETININGRSIEKDVTYINFGHPYYHIKPMTELKKLNQFPNLRSLSFCGSYINDEGLTYVADLQNIEMLNLQETPITNDGLAILASLKNLKSLRLKENDQLTDDCIVHLNKLENLTDLQIHETSITQAGLKELMLEKLEELTVYICDGNFTHESLLAFSKRFPNCEILAKGEAIFKGGQ